MRFKDRFAMFMQGRNGIDALEIALAVLYLVLTFVNVFFTSTILYTVCLVIFIALVFRFLSTNIDKRYRENLKYLQFQNQLKGLFLRKKNRANENKNYCFKRCPNCGKTLRLPRIKGKHNTKCPVCGCNFSVRVWFGKR